MATRIEELNAPIFELPDSHAAKRFLKAFLDCLSGCVGRELPWHENPIDQRWTSVTDGRTWLFSDFAYAHLSFDIVLDGFLNAAPALTPSEVSAVQRIPRLRTMTDECAQNARQSGNAEIVELTDQVLNMLDLWEEYLDFRRAQIARMRKLS
jgi:hypothetical protein